MGFVPEKIIWDVLNEITNQDNQDSEQKSLREKIVGAWKGMQLYKSGAIKGHSKFESWSLTKDGKIAI